MKTINLEKANPENYSYVEPYVSFLNKQSDFAYWGDRDQHKNSWIAYSQHRDSDALSRSNFRCIKAELIKKVGEENVIIESCSHWAVGWIEYLIIKTVNPEIVQWVEDTLKSLEEEYPVFDEDDLSGLEYDEWWDQWESWGADQAYSEIEAILGVEDGAEYYRKHEKKLQPHIYEVFAIDPDSPFVETDTVKQWLEYV